jgi:putative CocE/NonD family hydrolase
MPWLRGVVTRNRPDGYWRRLDATRELAKLDVAAQITVGYYDLFCADTVENFMRLPRSGKKQLILGPWDHGSIGKQVVGGVDFGPEVKFDLVAENLAWFDRYLKPSVSPRRVPPVRYFVMGDNVWRTAADWPPPEAARTPYYLHSGGRANSRAGDGTLSRRAPVASEPDDRFVSDPDHPVPSEAPDAPAPSRSTPWRPVDRRAIEDRRDVLIYTAAAQQTPLTIAGNVVAEIWGSADAPDADWVVKLVDVAPDGAARGLAEGILRSSARQPLQASLLEPGRRYLFTVDLGHTAATLRPGHALRVEVAGSAFPMFDRNLHTGEGPTGTRKQLATQTVQHRGGSASRLLLPVLPAAGSARGPTSAETMRR